MTILSKLNEAKPTDWDRVKGTHADGRMDFTPLCPPSMTVSDDVFDKFVGACSTQVGGSHYKNYKIQPIEYTLANNLNFCQGNVIKYITRYKDKNGAEDLRKAIHYIDILLDEYDRIEEEERKYEEDNGFY